eukprot:Selendium_serpulae@DN5203_c0_g2_i1.p1
MSTGSSIVPASSKLFPLRPSSPWTRCLAAALSSCCVPLLAAPPIAAVHRLELLRAVNSASNLFSHRPALTWASTTALPATGTLLANALRPSSLPRAARSPRRVASPSTTTHARGAADGGPSSCCWRLFAGCGRPRSDDSSVSYRYIAPPLANRHHSCAQCACSRHSYKPARSVAFAEHSGERHSQQMETAHVKGNGDTNGGPGLHWQPAKETNSTVIWMHGLGDTATGWQDLPAFLSMDKDFAHTKFILPSANSLPITMNGGMRMPAWADIMGLSAEAPEDERGYLSSKARVAALVAAEVENGVPRRRVV